MAIQMRRGQLADYDKNKMLAGEWGIAIDSDTERQKAFIAFGPGIDKEVMFVEDAAPQIAEVVDMATEEAEAWAHGDKFDTREFFSGDGTTKSFTLAYEPSSISGVFVDNARTTYTRSGKTITLATAPQSSSNNVRVDYTVNVSTDNAKYYKDSAQSSAYLAEVNASAAQTSSNTAVQKAGEASNSASQAQSSASTATSKASTATSAASTATTKANQAASSASQASSQATAAGNYAKVAEAWAVGTKGGTDVPSTDPQYHNNAKYYADQMGTISSDVSELKEDYTTIIDSAYVTDTASGSIASFPDGADNVSVKSLKVAIEPVQDLHGYDHPWPAGGGKNLLSMTVAWIKAANTSGTWSGNEYTYKGVTFSVLVDSDSNVTGVKTSGTANDAVIFGFGSFNAISGTSYTINGSPSGKSDSTYRLWGEGTAFPSGNRISDDKNERQTATAVATESTPIVLQVFSGVNVNNLTFYPMIRLASESDATFAPYSNICPISGRTAATVTRTGKNLFGGTFNEFFPLHFESDKTVIASADAVGSGIPQMGFYDENQVRIDYWGMGSAHSSVSGRVAKVIELPKESYYVKFIGDESTRYMIEFGNTNTTFESYVGNTYNITFPSEAGTVYGGTLDVTTGVLTVDTAYDVYDGSSDETWTDVSGGYSIRNDLTRENYAPITNRFRGRVGGTVQEPNIFYNSANVFNYRLGLNDPSVTDLASFKTWLSNNPIQVCCKLAQPVTVQLTPQQVTTLLGQNNVWSDCGDTEVEYRADTKLYIEKLTAPTEDDMIADHAISANSFFMVGNTLYRATNAIASGATITVGTNATKLSLSDALNALA